MQRSSAVGPAESVSHHERTGCRGTQDPETVNHVAEQTVAADEPAESVALLLLYVLPNDQTGPNTNACWPFLGRQLGRISRGVLVILDRVSELRLAPNAHVIG